MPYFKKLFGRLRLRSNTEQERNASEDTPSDSSLAERLDRQRTSASLNSRTETWLKSQPYPQSTGRPSNCSSTPSVHAIIGGKIVKRIPQKSMLKCMAESTAETPAKSVNSSVESKTKSKRFSLWNALVGIRYEAEDDIALPAKSDDLCEGDTLIEDDVTVVTSGELEGDTVVQDDTGDLHKEDEHDFSDFTKEEYFLFHKLNNRGVEPLLMANWHWHFRSFPANLFTTDATKAYIGHTGGSEFQAMKVLENMVHAGVLVRECFKFDQSPEKPLHNAVKKYFRWTMQDSKLDKKEHIPVLSVTCAHKGESAVSLIGRCTDRLHALGRQYRDMWRKDDIKCKSDDGIQHYMHELPTIFGIVIINSIVGFVTYDARYPGKAVRTMGNWDFGIAGQDVWHAFAVAIFVICARDYLMDLDDEGLLGPEIKDEDEDPDA